MTGSEAVIISSAHAERRRCVACACPIVRSHVACACSNICIARGAKTAAGEGSPHCAAAVIPTPSVSGAGHGAGRKRPLHFDHSACTPIHVRSVSRVDLSCASWSGMSERKCFAAAESTLRAAAPRAPYPGFCSASRISIESLSCWSVTPSSATSRTKLPPSSPPLPAPARLARRLPNAAAAPVASNAPPPPPMPGVPANELAPEAAAEEVDDVDAAPSPSSEIGSVAAAHCVRMPSSCRSTASSRRASCMISSTAAHSCSRFAMPSAPASATAAIAASCSRCTACCRSSAVFSLPSATSSASAAASSSFPSSSIARASLRIHNPLNSSPEEKTGNRPSPPPGASVTPTSRERRIQCRRRRTPEARPLKSVDAFRIDDMDDSIERATRVAVSIAADCAVFLRRAARASASA